LDEQELARQVAEDSDENRRTVTADPHGGRDRPEQRDQRQGIAHPPIEYVPKQYGDDQDADRERVREGSGMTRAPDSGLRLWLWHVRGIECRVTEC
jgi:hypothetical protein